MSNPVMEGFVHSPLGADRNAIRLLYLHPAYEYHAQIRCKLLHTNLDDKPMYKALSYAWGDPNIKLPILIDGKVYEVTANCYSALLRLRQTDENCLWIDAVCINQNDDEEKSIQVALMRDVYYSAREVIVWLGQSEAERQPDDEAKENLAFELLDDLRSESSIVDLASFSQYVQQTKVPEACWQLLKDMFSHVWFERLWTYQEYAVAAKARALLYYHSVPFNRIARVVDKLYVAMSRYCFIENPFREKYFYTSLCKVIMGLSMRLTAREYYDREKRQLHDMMLFNQMLFTSSFECFDPRDRVFGVIGLLSDDTKSKIQVNYAQSPSQLYTNVTWFMTQETENLEPICFKRTGPLDPLGDSAFPSWVRDWRLINGGLITRYYQASLNTRPVVSFAGDSATLEVHGVWIDTILEYARQDQSPQNILDIAEWTSKAPGLALWKSHFDIYPNSCDPMDAWIRTVTADLVQKNGEESRIDEEILQKIRVLFVANEVRGRVESFEESLESIEQYFVVEVIERNAPESKFFVSNLGYMGMGTDALQEGDGICILLGCSVPMLIRKEGDYHRLVGECFVWGLMDGEALQIRGRPDDYDIFHLR